MAGAGRGELMKNKFPRMSWFTKKLLNQYKERLINHDQKAGTFTPEISAIVYHIDAIIEINKESCCVCRKCRIQREVKTA